MHMYTQLQGACWSHESIKTSLSMMIVSPLRQENWEIVDGSGYTRSKSYISSFVNAEQFAACISAPSIVTLCSSHSVLNKSEHGKASVLLLRRGKGYSTLSERVFLFIFIAAHLAKQTQSVNLLVAARIKG